MKIDALLSIGRSSDDTVRIRVQDDSSRVQFLELKLTYEQFAQVITGLSYVQVEAEVAGLDVVGKVKVSETRSIECPIKDYDRNVLEAWLKENAKEESWIVDSYLGSQSSIVDRVGKRTLNYRVYKFVDKA